MPKEIKEIQFASENNTLIVPISEPDGACTADETPKTFVIQLEKELSEKNNELIIIKSNTETTVPFE